MGSHQAVLGVLAMHHEPLQGRENGQHLGSVFISHIIVCVMSRKLKVNLTISYQADTTSFSSLSHDSLSCMYSLYKRSAGRERVITHSGVGDSHLTSTRSIVFSFSFN